MKTEVEEPEIIAEYLLGVAESEYGDKYHDHLLEQYKIYLQMLDKISDRRSMTNTFFLTVNTALISAIGLANLIAEKTSVFLYVVICVPGLLLCYSWYRIIRSYRDLNTHKFIAIHEIEKYLPLRPFDAEWESCGRGRDRKRYWPFTHIERYVPWIFMILYIALMVYGIHLAIGRKA